MRYIIYYLSHFMSGESMKRRLQVDKSLITEKILLPGKETLESVKRNR